MAAVLAVAAAAWIAPVAPAQSPAELRQENEALRTQVRDLQQELQAARAKITELEAEIQRLNELVRRLAAGSTPPTDPGQQPPAVEPKVTIDESKPNASPRALLAALKTSYAEAAIEVPTDNERLRRAGLTKLRRWANSANSRFRSSFDWHIRLDEVLSGQRGYRMTVTAVDPVTHAVLGDSFDLEVPRNRALVLEQPGQENVKFVVLKGVLIPAVAIDESRPVAGAFGDPLIGPYAVFGFRVEQVAITLPQPEKDAGTAGG